MKVSKLPNPYSDNGKILPEESELTGSINHIAHFRYLRTATLNSILVSGHVNVSFLSKEKWNSNRCTKENQRPTTVYAYGCWN